MTERAHTRQMSSYSQSSNGTVGLRSIFERYFVDCSGPEPSRSAAKQFFIAWISHRSPQQAAGQASFPHSMQIR
jgi:hypothetical protein